MALLLPLLTALVVSSYGPGGSLGCDLPQDHVLVSRKNFVLLGRMRRISPFLCLRDRKDFRFPQEMVGGSQFQEAQAISVLHEMLQQIFSLFHTERSSAAWNTTLLDRLCTGLHQQLEDLDTCLVQAMGEEKSALGTEGPALAVKRYFREIHLYLKEKKYSDCAWEIVRGEIMRSFSSSRKLQAWNPSSSEFQAASHWRMLTMFPVPDTGLINTECGKSRNRLEAGTKTIEHPTIEGLIIDYLTLCGIFKFFGTTLLLIASSYLHV
ncbi:Interferon omega-1 [Manis javanica]|nr:Interferon omega-1 [Manis javanica]